MAEATQLAKTNGLKFGGRKITVTMKKQAVAWAKEEISTATLGKLWDFNSHQVTQILYRAAVALREAVREGLLK
jgi:hypothetical protein